MLGCVYDVTRLVTDEFMALGPRILSYTALLSCMCSSALPVIMKKI